MDVAALEEAITRDIRLGFTPLCVVAAVGTTGSTAIDPLRAIAAICRKHGIWLHVDAAFAGSALILPECRWMADGMEDADSFVFNPHKWMLTNFDCSAYFVRDAAALVRTFEILPGVSEDPGGRPRQQLSRLGDPARPAVPGAEALVRDPDVRRVRTAEDPPSAYRHGAAAGDGHPVVSRISNCSPPRRST